MLLSNTVFFLRFLVTVFNFYRGYEVCVTTFNLCVVILTSDVVSRYAAALERQGIRIKAESVFHG